MHAFLLVTLPGEGVTHAFPLQNHFKDSDKSEDMDLSVLVQKCHVKGEATFSPLFCNILPPFCSDWDGIAPLVCLSRENARLP